MIGLLARPVVKWRTASSVQEILQWDRVYAGGNQANRIHVNITYLNASPKEREQLRHHLGLPFLINVLSPSAARNELQQMLQERKRQRSVLMSSSTVRVERVRRAPLPSEYRPYVRTRRGEFF
jgi:hypothetical protein